MCHAHGGDRSNRNRNGRQGRRTRARRRRGRQMRNGAWWWKWATTWSRNFDGLLSRRHLHSCVRQRGRRQTGLAAVRCHRHLHHIRSGCCPRIVMNLDHLLSVGPADRSSKQLPQPGSGGDVTSRRIGYQLGRNRRQHRAVVIIIWGRRSPGVDVLFLGARRSVGIWSGAWSSGCWLEGVGAWSPVLCWGGVNSFLIPFGEGSVPVTPDTILGAVVGAH